MVCFPVQSFAETKNQRNTPCLGEILRTESCLELDLKGSIIIAIVESAASQHYAPVYWLSGNNNTGWYVACCWYSTRFTVHGIPCCCCWYFYTHRPCPPAAHPCRIVVSRRSSSRRKWLAPTTKKVICCNDGRNGCCFIIALLVG